MTTDDRTIDVAGGAVFTRTWKPDRLRSDVPLVLLHDSLGCVDLWRDFPETLSAVLGRTVVAYDRLGFGRSSPVASPASLTFIQDEADSTFSAAMDALGIREFSLFGYSVGGSIALTIASRMPGRCRAVISESAQAFVEEHTIKGVQDAMRRFADPDQIERLARWHGDKARWVLDAWFNVWLSPAFADWSLAGALPDVRCPVLVIHGDRDEYGTRRFPEMICGLAGGTCRMEIFENCGHMPHRERLEDVLRLVDEFLL